MGMKYMPYVLWTIACLFAYVAGLVILIRVTPLLLARAYDEGLFMAIAAVDVFGGIFAFGAVAITFALFSGMFAIRVLDFLLLLGIAIVAGRMSYRSYRPRRIVNPYLVSRIVAGSYCLLLLLASVFYLGLLFTPNP